MADKAVDGEEGGPGPEKKPFIVFDSWKSDHPPTRAFISKALEIAADLVMASRPGIQVVIDHATRDLPGSPNIPGKIMEKIRIADMVVSDVTTINPKARSRRAPNPNVAFELGYAAATVGWDRIVILFDTGVANFKDLPFDFDRQRAMQFSSAVAVDDAPDAKSKKRKGLGGALANAMEKILDKDPARPTADMTPEQVKREHDRKQLLWLLSQFDPGALDQFVAVLPKVITDAGDHMWLGVDGVMSSSHFALHDDELAKLADDFRRAFGGTLSFDSHYDSAPDLSRYVFNRSNTTAERAEKALVAVSAARDKLADALPAFLDGVRRKFPDIDLDVTSKAARDDYRKHRDSLKDAFD